MKDFIVNLTHHGLKLSEQPVPVRTARRVYRPERPSDFMPRSNPDYSYILRRRFIER